MLEPLQSFFVELLVLIHVEHHGQPDLGARFRQPHDCETIKIEIHAVLFAESDGGKHRSRKRGWKLSHAVRDFRCSRLCPPAIRTNTGQQEVSACLLLKEVGSDQGFANFRYPVA